MTVNISYRFRGQFFDYEIEYNKFIDGVLKVFSNNYEIPFDKVKELYEQDWIDAEKVYDVFKEDIDEYFKGDAYKQYEDWRLA